MLEALFKAEIVTWRGARVNRAPEIVSSAFRWPELKLDLELGPELWPGFALTFTNHSHLLEHCLEVLRLVFKCMQYHRVFASLTRSFFTTSCATSLSVCSPSCQAVVQISEHTLNRSISARTKEPFPLSPRYLRPMATLKRKAELLSASTSDLKKPKKDASLTSFFGAPKATSVSTKSGTSPASTAAFFEHSTIKFDKDKWVKGLSDEQRKLLKLEIDTLDSSWLAHLRDEVVHKDFLELKRFLQKERDSGKKIFPPAEEVYSWFA
jgi:hypothetical protein